LSKRNEDASIEQSPRVMPLDYDELVFVRTVGRVVTWSCSVSVYMWSVEMKRFVFLMGSLVLLSASFVFGQDAMQ
jgi:hypothetical protein